MSECWLYQATCLKTDNRKGRLLYAGISDSPSCRMGNHESQKWWWWLVDQVVWSKCENREDALRRESSVIETSRPLFNLSQSTLTGWDRLSGAVDVLWNHEHNTVSNPACPFCDSHGEFEILGQHGCHQLFKRNSDDKLVIHFETSCDMHKSDLNWAVHVHVLDFLAGFGKVPHAEAEMLLSKGYGDAPWENRMERMPTLCEMLNGTSLKSLTVSEA
jgi:hypothetical protein